MATPVGPVPTDPDDPDLWDWSGDDEPGARRHPGRALVAALVALALVMPALVLLLVRSG